MSASETAQGPKRGRPRDPTLRAHVLTVVAAQLGTTGFADMTMEGVLADSGIAKRTLYRWWPSKSAMIASALAEGYVDLPDESVPLSADVWEDLSHWFKQVAIAMGGPYGDVLRTAAAISASDATLNDTLTEAFTVPARLNLLQRLAVAVDAGQISADVDIDAVVDLLMAIIVFIAVGRGDATRVQATLAVIRSGAAGAQG